PPSPHLRTLGYPLRVHAPPAIGRPPRPALFPYTTLFRSSPSTSAQASAWSRSDTSPRRPSSPSRLPPASACRRRARTRSGSFSLPLSSSAAITRSSAAGAALPGSLVAMFGTGFTQPGPAPPSPDWLYTVRARARTLHTANPVVEQEAPEEPGLEVLYRSRPKPGTASGNQ